jgi:thiol-disulfide isomerase/thioredoxin
MPYLGELNKEYADKGVQFIGIVSDATAETPDEIELAKEIRDYTGADYLHILVSESVYDAMLTTVQAIPTSFIVNSKGEIVSEVSIGSRSKEDWKTFIDETIKAQG